MNFRKYVFVIIFFLVLAGIHLFIYTHNIALKYRITELKIKLSELNSGNRALGSLAAKEENLAHVEKAAREKLGMIYPERIIYILETREGDPTPVRK
jgi:cell division protein FtsB